MATKRLIKVIFFALTVFSLEGCGIIYTSTTKPYVLNMQQTPVSEKNSRLSSKVISIPTTQLSAGWDNRAIGEIAKNAGITEIYYADVHTFSVLAGLWSEQQIIVYGR